MFSLLLSFRYTVERKDLNRPIIRYSEIVTNLILFYFCVHLPDTQADRIYSNSFSWLHFVFTFCRMVYIPALSWPPRFFGFWEYTLRMTSEQKKHNRRRREYGKKKKKNKKQKKKSHTENCWCYFWGRKFHFACLSVDFMRWNNKLNKTLNRQKIHLYFGKSNMYLTLFQWPCIDMTVVNFSSLLLLHVKRCKHFGLVGMFFCHDKKQAKWEAIKALA